MDSGQAEEAGGGNYCILTNAHFQLMFSNLSVACLIQLEGIEIYPGKSQRTGAEICFEKKLYC